MPGAVEEARVDSAAGAIVQTAAVQKVEEEAEVSIVVRVHIKTAALLKVEGGARVDIAAEVGLQTEAKAGAGREVTEPACLDLNPGRGPGPVPGPGPEEGAKALAEQGAVAGVKAVTGVGAPAARAPAVAAARTKNISKSWRQHDAEKRWRKC